MILLKSAFRKLINEMIGFEIKNLFNRGPINLFVTNTKII